VDTDKGATAMNKLLLTAGEAAEILGIGRTKVYELLRVGAIESVRVGASRRIPAAALDEYVEWLRAEASGYEVA
jgi:excisionase family DNA binding protein